MEENNMKHDFREPTSRRRRKAILRLINAYLDRMKELGIGVQGYPYGRGNIVRRCGVAV